MILATLVGLISASDLGIPKSVVRSFVIIFSLHRQAENGLAAAPPKRYAPALCMNAAISSITGTTLSAASDSRLNTTRSTPRSA
jgi:hypothetical protein